jgi:hypothetical protein
MLGFTPYCPQIIIVDVGNEASVTRQLSLFCHSCYRNASPLITECFACLMDRPYACVVICITQNESETRMSDKYQSILLTKLKHFYIIQPILTRENMLLWTLLRNYCTNAWQSNILEHEEWGFDCSVGFGILRPFSKITNPIPQLYLLKGNVF